MFFESGQSTSNVCSLKVVRARVTCVLTAMVAMATTEAELSRLITAVSTSKWIHTAMVAMATIEAELSRLITAVSTSKRIHTAMVAMATIEAELSRLITAVSTSKRIHTAMVAMATIEAELSRLITAVSTSKRIHTAMVAMATTEVESLSERRRRQTSDCRAVVVDEESVRLPIVSWPCCSGGLNPQSVVLAKRSGERKRSTFHPSGSSCCLFVA